MVIVMPSKKGDFNDLAQTHGTNGVIHALNKSVKIDNGTDHTNGISHGQIKICLEKISNQIQLKLPDKKNKTVDQSKSLQRFEMEI